jgi:hypothetical protein
MKIALQLANELNPTGYPAVSGKLIVYLQDETAPLALKALPNGFRGGQVHGDRQVIQFTYSHLLKSNLNPRRAQWRQATVCL